MRTRRTRWNLGGLMVVVLLVLVAGGPAPAQTLYRCVDASGAVSWQDAACAAGTLAEQRAFDPKLARAPAPVAVHEPDESGGSRNAPTARRAPARMRPDPQQLACRQARQEARARSDADGHRLPSREIRARERRARELCD